MIKIRCHSYMVRLAGTRVSMRLGSGMVQQMQHSCNQCKCKGTYETINQKDQCPQCKSEKIVLEKKALEVVIDKGTPNSSKITFQVRWTKCLTESLVMSDHPTCKRKSDDLFVERTILTRPSVDEFQIVLNHLHKRQLLIKSNPCEVIKPGQFKAIIDEGTPIYQRPFMRWNMYILFTGDFPDFGSVEGF